MSDKLERVTFTVDITELANDDSQFIHVECPNCSNPLTFIKKDISSGVICSHYSCKKLIRFINNNLQESEDKDQEAA